MTTTATHLSGIPPGYRAEETVHNLRIHLIRVEEAMHAVHLRPK